MRTSSQVQMDIRITHLNHWPKKHQKTNKQLQVYLLQKQGSFHIFLIRTGIDPCFRYLIAKSGTNLVHSHPSHILCLTACVKVRKSFHGVLPCLVMMHHQTNLDCKTCQKVQYFRRSSRNDCGFDLGHSKMIFLNDTLANDNASPY